MMRKLNGNRYGVGLLVLVLLSVLSGCGDETDQTIQNGDQDVVETAGDGDEPDPDGDADPDGVDGDAEDEEIPAKFVFAVIADTHIIDDYYEGPEGNALDTETIFKANDRLVAVGDYMNASPLDIKLVMIAGDFAHNFPSDDPSFYETHTDTRFHIAKELIDRFDMPVYPGFGNHDYRLNVFSREWTNQLYKDVVGIDPYYYVDYQGWRFIHLNNFLGETKNPESPEFESGLGSFGREQLEWLEALLEEGLPSFIFVHYPLSYLKYDEFEDLDIFRLLDTYQDTIKTVFAGHMHTWIDFGDSYGPPHEVIGSTRYDDDAYVLVEVDRETGAFTFLNGDCWTELSNYSLPYDPDQGCVQEEEDNENSWR